MSARGPEAEAGSAVAGEPCVEIHVLGPVEVVCNGRVVEIGGVKARALVARLLVDRNIVVSVDTLADALWGEDENGDAGHIALRSTVSRLRKRIRVAACPDELIVTRAPGYLLDLPAEATDAYRFERLVAAGFKALRARRPGESVRLLCEAEALWRGPAYEEVRDEPFARAEARRLDEMRVSAAETRIDAELTMGRHESLVGDLESLTSRHPLRERLWSQRMLALYRSSRQAEALRVYQEVRSLLVRELGIEPGKDLVWMEHAVLTQDPALSFPALPDEGGIPAPSAPAEPPAYRIHVRALQHDTPFVGRETELAELRDWWDSVGAGRGRMLLVDGDSGIGKTRLVAELARALEAEGVLVLWGRCDETPIAPFLAFAEALGRYFQSVSADRISRMPEWQLTEMSRLVMRLREYAPPDGEEVDQADHDRFRFFEAVTATLNELSSGGPILLVIDDLHRVDQPTLLLLRHLLRNASDATLGFIGIYVDTEVEDVDQWRRGLGDVHRVHEVGFVHLRGLDPGAVEDLTATWAGAPLDLVPELCRLTDGNPLFVEELLRQFREGDGASDEIDDEPAWPNLTATESIRELVSRRVAAYCPRT